MLEKIHGVQTELMTTQKTEAAKKKLIQIQKDGVMNILYCVGM